jgi:glycosyltransferase involved in cell wall biosynthesis
MNIALVRGKHLNNFATQNFDSLARGFNVETFSSLCPIETNSKLKNHRFASLADLSKLFPERVVKYLSNRTLGDMHNLWNMESQLAKFDILHTADSYYYYSYQLARYKQTHPGKILLITPWETIPFNNEGTSAKKRIKYFVYKQASHFLCYTQKAKEALILEGISADKISVIKLGIDTRRFMPAKAKQKNILFVGRLEKEKGILELLAAYKLICETVVHNLIIVGQGSLKSQVLSFINTHRLQNRVSLQTVPYAKMHKCYQDAEIFVLPSQKTATWEEQYGMVLAEAMASGMAIIGSNNGAVKEVIGSAGLLLKDPQAKIIAIALKKLTDNTKRVRKLSASARKRAEIYYNKEVFAQKLKRLYEKLYRSNFNQK